MPTLMPKDTADALGQNAKNCDSRSLMLERFADPTAKEDERKAVFTRASNRKALTTKSTAWPAFLSDSLGLKPDALLYAQLRSRLMVNMAGGVMENAGLCLDRLGLPYIPGSALKGCARRMALQELLEAETPVTKGQLLFQIARVFGWGDTDWKTGRKRKRQNGREVPTEPHSDFWWAMAQDSGDRQTDDERRDATWNQVRSAVSNRLLDQLRACKREHPQEPWLDLPNFAGGVSFLPAYPVELGKQEKVEGLPLPLPELGKLELDVVTCHHRDYYAGELDVATDTEEPVPVVFPAVAPGHVFVFALTKLRTCSGTDLSAVRTWLACGLSTFGLGAKTNAGYGWFQDVTERIRAAEQAAQQERAERDRLDRERAEREAARATLEPDLALLEKLKVMKEQDLRGQINPYATEPQFWTQKDERVQLTLLHFLLVAAPEQFATDRANSKSKIAKAISHLTAKFPHVATAKP